jgi:Thiamine pyrophosphate enzyme, C-terminal TPP binding domain
MIDVRQTIARSLADTSPISVERLGLELEANLDRDTCYVADVDSGKSMDQLMTFGGDDKQYFSTGPNVLGWGMAAAFGVKLARPDVPVVSVVGDGSFCFSGPQPLWSMARYKAPVTVMVLNNHSYNNERNRIWNSAGQQFEAARDMTCYLGDPDVDYAKAADAFGVEGEVVKEPAALKAAFDRAKRAMVEGRPYLLDIHIKREGLGAVSEWHPPYSSPICAPARYDHAHHALVSGRAGVGSGRFTEPRATKRQPFAGGRRARPGYGHLFAMPLSRHHRQDPRRQRRLAALCQQHGAARRAIDRPRDRHRGGLSGAQSGSWHQSAAGKTRRTAEWAGPGIGRDTLQSLPRPRTRRLAQTAQNGLADHRRQYGGTRCDGLAGGSTEHLRLSGREFGRLSAHPRKSRFPWDLVQAACSGSHLSG